MTATLRLSFSPRTRTRAFAILAVATAVACRSDQASGPNGPPSDEAAAAAVSTFGRMADSVNKSGGDPGMGTTYASLAEAVRVAGRVSPVTIVIDGVPTRFLATAQQTDYASSPCGIVPDCLALGMVHVQRTLIAWQESNPKRIVQLSSSSDADSIYTQIYPSFAKPSFPTASLVYLDGNGGVYYGTSGTQSAAMTATGEPCPTIATDKPMITIYPAPGGCTLADFAIAFAAGVEPSQFLEGRSNATGTHTITMARQSVIGVRFEFTPTPYDPPVPVEPVPWLPADLAVSVNGTVTLTLKITNPDNTPTTLGFTSGQRYDFQVYDANTGASVWTWSADKAFIAALGTETLAANGSLTYTESWTPPRKGTFVAVGTLTSSSHSAAAKAMVEVR